MPTAASTAKIRLFLTAGLIAIALVFAVSAISRASAKPLWSDEKYNISLIPHEGYGKLLVHGMFSQMSGAPLEFMCLKFVHGWKERARALGLPETVHYRLYSIFFSLVSGLAVIWLALRRLKKEDPPPGILWAQGLLLLMALLVYYFHPLNFMFSIETRGYALWNALWFSAIAWIMVRGGIGWPVIVMLALMGATMTAAVFQLLAIGAAYFIVQCSPSGGEVVAWPKALTRAIKLFILPAGVTLYYLLLPTSQTPGAYSQTLALAGFVKYWLNHAYVPVLAITALYMTWGKKRYFWHNMVFLTVLILYFLGPLVIYLTLLRNCYFVARHYLYNELVYPLFLMHLAFLLPGFFAKDEAERPRFMFKKFLWLLCLFVPMYSLQYIFWDYGAIKTVRLNESMPNSGYHDLVATTEQGLVFTPGKIKEYLNYYEHLVRYMPQLPEGHGMQGFCYYQLGQTEKALQAYEKASQLAPDFFWYYLNPATIYFNEGWYEKALGMLGSLRNADMPRSIVRIIASQRVYMPVRAVYVQEYDQPIQEQVLAGNVQARKLFVLSSFHLKRYADVLAHAREAVEAKMDTEGFFSYYAGRAAFELGIYQQAAFFFVEVMRKAPDVGEAYHYMALMLRAAGKEAEADVLEKKYRALMEGHAAALPWREDHLPLQIY